METRGTARSTLLRLAALLTLVTGCSAAPRHPDNSAMGLLVEIEGNDIDVAAIVAPSRSLVAATERNALRYEYVAKNGTKIATGFIADPRSGSSLGENGEPEAFWVNYGVAEIQVPKRDGTLRIFDRDGEVLGQTAVRASTSQAAAGSSKGAASIRDWGSAFVDGLRGLVPTPGSVASGAIGAATGRPTGLNAAVECPENLRGACTMTQMGNRPAQVRGRIMFVSDGFAPTLAERDPYGRRRDAFLSKASSIVTGLRAADSRFANVSFSYVIRASNGIVTNQKQPEKAVLSYAPSAGLLTFANWAEGTARVAAWKRANNEQQDIIVVIANSTVAGMGKHTDFVIVSENYQLNVVAEIKKIFDTIFRPTTPAATPTRMPTATNSTGGPANRTNTGVPSAAPGTLASNTNEDDTDDETDCDPETDPDCELDEDQDGNGADCESEEDCLGTDDTDEEEEDSSGYCYGEDDDCECIDEELCASDGLEGDDSEDEGNEELDFGYGECEEYDECSDDTSDDWDSWLGNGDEFEDGYDDDSGYDDDDGYGGDDSGYGEDDDFGDDDSYGDDYGDDGGYGEDYEY